MTEQDLKDIIDRLQQALETQQIVDGQLVVSSDPVLDAYAYLTTLRNDWSRR